MERVNIKNLITSVDQGVAAFERYQDLMVGDGKAKLTPK